MVAPVRILVNVFSEIFLKNIDWISADIILKSITDRIC